MNQADSAEYWMDELIKALNKLHKRAITDERASTYLNALDDIAEEMGITVTKVYTR